MDNFFLRWSSLKKIRRLGLGKALSLFLILVPTLASIKVILRDSGILLDVPANMFILYFASLSFYVACVIFDLRCPRVISDNDSKYTFVQRCLNHSTCIIEFRDHAQSKIEQILSQVREQAGEGPMPPDLEKMLERELEIEGADALENIWLENDRDRQVSAILMQALIALSFGLLGYLTLFDAPARVLSAF